MWRLSGDGQDPSGMSWRCYVSKFMESAHLEQALKVYVVEVVVGLILGSISLSLLRLGRDERGKIATIILHSVAFPSSEPPALPKFHF